MMKRGTLFLHVLACSGLLAGCGGTGSEGLVDTPGRSASLAPSLDRSGAIPTTKTGLDLHWELVSPSANLGSGGKASSMDRRLTLAVTDTGAATWWLETRLSELEALSLQQSLVEVVATWSDVPGRKDVPAPLTLEILAQPAAGGNQWTVARMSSRPGAIMSLQSGDSTVATVSMDLRTADDLQRRLGGLARTTYGQGFMAIP